jgi:putative PIN family toxin of toxin-antitoxin system
MDVPDIVIDTNVLIAALRSKRGASFKLLWLVGTQKFEIHDSVPLILEYEDIAQRFRVELGLSQEDISDLIDALCSQAHHHEIYFLWRPSLSDPNDEFILDLAVSAQCDYIVTHNLRDFKDVEKFGIKVVTPGMFLKIIGEV